MDNSAVATAEYTIISLTHAGTQTDPYDVADARTAIDANAGITDVYATGIVSEIVTAFNSQYGNISYNISADGLTTSAQLQVFRGKSYNGDNFTSADDIQVGDVVVVYGNLKKYGDIYEFDANNELVSLDRVQMPRLTVDPTTAAAFTYEQGEGPSDDQIFEVTGSNLTSANISVTVTGEFEITDDVTYGSSLTVASGAMVSVRLKAGLTKGDYTGQLTFASEGANDVVINLTGTVTYTEPTIEPAKTSVTVDFNGCNGTIDVAYTKVDKTQAVVKFFDVAGSETTYDWISANINEGNLEYSVAYNSSDARTAYLQIFVGNISSQVITIEQGGYQVDYATLQFDFDGGKADIENTTGLTQEGLGSDYKSSPYLKFDGTGDWVELKINEVPGVLTFVVKGNSFSGGTFTVQESADGVTYTTVKNFTEGILASGESTQTIDNLSADTRYIKWIYTEKVSGNVALGNIKLAKPSTEPYISVDPTTVVVDAAGGNGTISVTYTNIDNIAAEVHFYEADGTTTATYDWIDAEIDAENNIYYVVGENTGEARTAYLKVYALDNDANDVFSELITISQKEYVAPFEPTTYTLATSIEPGKHYIIANRDAAVAMGEQKNNNRATAEVTVNSENNTITVESAGVYEFVIDYYDGLYSIYDEANKTYLYAASSTSNYLKGEATIDNNAVWSIDFDSENVATIIAQGSNSHNYMRYNASGLFSCYTANNNQDDVYLYVKNGDTGNNSNTMIIPMNENGLKTFASNVDLDFTNTPGIEAYKAVSGSGNEFALEKVNQVAAGEGVLLRATTNFAEFDVEITSGVEAFSANSFKRGEGENVATGDGPYNYILNVVNNELGFYQANGNKVAKNRAYLQTPYSTARISLNFDNTTTGIADIKVNSNDEAVYNLSGQRVAKAVKGLYIVNGKKIFVK